MSIERLPQFSTAGYVILTLLGVSILWLLYTLLSMSIGTLLLAAFTFFLGYALGRA